MNEIIVTPRILDIAVRTERKIAISGHSDNITPARNGFETAWFDFNSNLYQLNDALHNIHTISNPVIAGDKVVTRFNIARNQPFSFYCQTAGYEAYPYNCEFGIMTPSDLRSYFSYSTFNVNGNINHYAWAFSANNVIVITPQLANPLESWKIVSDGITISAMRGDSVVHSFAIPLDLPNFVIYFAHNFTNCFFHNVNITIPEQVELINAETVTKIFTPPENIETRIVGLNNFYIKPLTAINRDLMLSHPSVPTPVVVRLNVANLYLRRKNNISHIVQELDVVSFEANADGGIFTASSGVIVDSVDLKWQAIQQGSVVLKYVVGEYTAEYTVQVIPRISIKDVTNNYYDIQVAQGDTFQFISNIAGDFECLNYENCLAPNGKFKAPSDATNAFFGKINLQIRFTAYGLQFDFIVEVMPMFPNMKIQGGVIHEHWEQHHRDFLPVTRKTVGGRKEARNQNKNGTIMWKVRYSNLKFGSACEGDLRFSAKRLDDFYRMVSTADYFTLIDIHTNELFRFVTIEDYAGNHEGLYSNDQIRDLTMYYDGGETQL